MQIEGKILDESDVGRCVRYIPTHANGNVSHPDVEDGRITSWNEVNVFVDYGHCSHPATSPGDLIWGHASQFKRDNLIEIEIKQ